MTNREFMSALNDIDDDLVTGAKPTAEKPIAVKLEKVRPWKAIAAAAAGVAVIAGAAVAAPKLIETLPRSRAESNSNGVEIIEFDKSGMKLFDSKKNADAVEFALEEIPGVSFECSADGLIMSENGAEQLIGFEGERVLEAYLGDFDQDGKREVFLNHGEDYRYSRILDVERGVLYELKDPEFNCLFACGEDFADSDKLQLLKKVSGEIIREENADGYEESDDVIVLAYSSEDYPIYGVSVVHRDTDYFQNFKDGLFVDYLPLNVVKQNLRGDVLNVADGVVKLNIGNLTDCEFTMSEFPGETFVKRMDDIYLKGGSRVLISTSSIFDVYFADLNGDGKREIVCECWNGLSGLSATYITAYDHANSKLYILQHQLYMSDMLNDYGLEIRDGVLNAIGYSVGNGKELFAEPLTLGMMNEIETRNDQIAYEDKTYTIVKDLITDEGAKFMIGLTKPEYEAGEYVELLCVVENTSDKEIFLQTPVIGGDYNLEFNASISQAGAKLRESYDGEGYGLCDAMGETPVKPGERFIHAMRFDTLRERLDDEDTIIPLCMPSGEYSGVVSVTLLSDPNDTTSEARIYYLDLSVSVTQRGEVKGPERGAFAPEEFGGYVTVLYNDQGLWFDDSLHETEIFSGMPIENLYLLDLNGDGVRELCANVSVRSDIHDARIVAYDLANRKLYELSDRGYYDYNMRVEHSFDRYVPYAQKLKHATNILVKETALTLDIMTEVTKPSSAIREPVEGVTEITEFGKAFSMEEFPEKEFILGERLLKAADKDGGEREMFNTKIENVYLYDTNGDGKREIIVKGFCNVSNGNTGETSYDAEKIITIFDLENDCGINMFPGKRECALVINSGKLYISINGKDEWEPVTYDRFEVLAKSL